MTKRTLRYKLYLLSTYILKTMFLYTWAKKYKVSPEAMAALYQECCIMTSLKTSNAISKNTEAEVQALVRREASELGLRLWRNNVGAVHTVDGRFLRYGLANDSAQLNSQIKSADLIGIRPIKITLEHVGLTIGQFVSREVKKGNWRYRGTEREEAQLKWMALILTLGGDACFATGVGTL